MLGKEVKESKAVSINEVVEILESRKKSSELTYEQQIALEHAKKFVQSTARAEKLNKALDALGILSLKGILKVIEIMPKNAMLLKQILVQEKKTFTEEDISKILAIIREKD
jgi:DNA-directed RNA polymerase subunit F